MTASWSVPPAPHPKRLDEAAVVASDVVITMGCGDTCTFYPGKRYEDRDKRYEDRELTDPAGRSIAVVRPIRGCGDFAYG